MKRTSEEEKQLWDDQIAKHQRTIAEHESEITRIRHWWDSEPRFQSFNSRIRHLEEEIGVERICLLAAVEKRQSLEDLC